MLGSATPLMMDIANDVLGLPQKPTVSPVESIPGVNFLNALREHGIREIVILGLLTGHIGQDHCITDMMVFFAELPQSRVHISIEGSLVTHIKALNAVLGDKLLNGSV
jgi:hypothetical protein